MGLFAADLVFRRGLQWTGKPHERELAARFSEKNIQHVTRTDKARQAVRSDMRTGAIHPRIRKRLEDTLRDKRDLLADHQVEAIRVVERAIRELSLLADLPGLGFLNVLSPKYEIALAELRKIDPDRPPDRRRLLAMAEELRELDQFLATLSKTFRGAVDASPKAQGGAPSAR